MKTVLVDWNLIPYAEAWQRQTEWFDTLVRAKAQGEAYENRIIMCEHPHVYTLGRSGKENNMLLNDDQLKAIQATLFHIDRGGDITYHGPGQLVCYPILNLEEFHLGLKEYVHLLEEAVIRVCRLTREATTHFSWRRKCFLRMNTNELSRQTTVRRC